MTVPRAPTGHGQAWATRLLRVGRGVIVVSSYGHTLTLCLKDNRKSYFM